MLLVQPREDLTLGKNVKVGEDKRLARLAYCSGPAKAFFGNNDWLSAVLSLLLPKLTSDEITVGEAAALYQRCCVGLAPTENNCKAQ